MFDPQCHCALQMFYSQFPLPYKCSTHNALYHTNVLPTMSCTIQMFYPQCPVPYKCSTHNVLYHTNVLPTMSCTIQMFYPQCNSALQIMGNLPSWDIGVGDFTEIKNMFKCYATQHICLPKLHKKTLTFCK